MEAVKGAAALTAMRNAAYTVAVILAVIGVFQILIARSYCDLDPCSGPRADPSVVMQIWVGSGLLVVAAVVAAAGFILHRRLRSQFPDLFPPGSGWMGTRNALGFLAILALLAAIVQWEVTGERWAPSQCDHDGTPIEQCPDYGYHGDQILSLWIAGGYLAVAVVSIVAAVYAHWRVKRHSISQGPLETPGSHPSDRVSIRLLGGSVVSAVLALALFAIGRFDRLAFAYLGLLLAAVAVACALACLVWPRSSILAKWSSAFVVAVGVLAGFLNYGAIIWSTME